MEIHLLTICPYQQVFILKPVSICISQWVGMDTTIWVLPTEHTGFSVFLFLFAVLQLDVHLLQKTGEGAKRFLIDALFDNCIEPGRKSRHEENREGGGVKKKRTKGI